ncbi:hypothetical protein ACIF8T_27185 [Streptomyces sp. NPDC085946]|uniref:hypothetical protein n=1 Tax=Streptomyces sp. NPDC085946 TaxID=3365744 RepID=UPI0037D1C685
MTEGDVAQTVRAERPERLSVVATAACGVRVLALALAGEIDHHTGDRLRLAAPADAVIDCRPTVRQALGV